MKQCVDRPWKKNSLIVERIIFDPILNWWFSMYAVCRLFRMTNMHNLLASATWRIDPNGRVASLLCIYIHVSIERFYAIYRWPSKNYYRYYSSWWWLLLLFLRCLFEKLRFVKTSSGTLIHIHKPNMTWSQVTWKVLYYY